MTIREMMGAMYPMVHRIPICLILLAATPVVAQETGAIAARIEAVAESCEKIVPGTITIGPGSKFIFSGEPSSIVYETTEFDLGDIRSVHNFRITCAEPGCIRNVWYGQRLDGTPYVMQQQTRSFARIVWCSDYQENVELAGLLREYVDAVKSE